MNRKKLMATMAGVMALSVGLTACGKDNAGSGDPETGKNNENKIFKLEATSPDKVPDAAKQRKDTLVIGLDKPDGIFNPLYADSAYDLMVLETMFTPLLNVKDDGTLEAALSELPKVSDDKKTYTYKLKDGLKWSDGQPITTDDIEFTFKIIADGGYGGQQDMPTMGLKGWKDYKEGKSKDIAGIKKVDKQTIELTVDTPLATTDRYLAITPIPMHYYGKDYVQGKADNSMTPLHRKPEVVSGAYKLKAYKEGEEVDLVTNDNFYLGKTKIPNLIFKVVTSQTRLQQLQTGEIDMSNVNIRKEDMEQIKEMGFCNVHYWPNNGYGYAGFNLLGNDSKFKDPKVRQALVYGLNRDKIVSNVYGEYGNVINIPQSPLSWSYNDEGCEKYEYNKEKAAKLLEEAGWKKNASGKLEKDGKEFKIRFLQTTPNEVNDSLVPIAKECYNELGIEFSPEQLDFPTMRKKLDDAKAGKASADYDMFFMAWGLTAEPDATAIFTSTGTQNKNGYTNKKVDELSRKGLEEFDREKRKGIYKELYKELNTDLPYIYMYQRRDGWSVSSRVENFKMSPYRNFTVDIQNLTLK